MNVVGQATNNGGGPRWETLRELEMNVVGQATNNGVDQQRRRKAVDPAPGILYPGLTCHPDSKGPLVLSL